MLYDDIPVTWQEEEEFEVLLERQFSIPVVVGPFRLHDLTGLLNA